MRSLLLILAIAFCSGCSHVISQQSLKEAGQEIPFEELQKSPDSYCGQTVILGGVIVETVNKKDGTVIEIYQTAVDGQGKPVNTDSSAGRFLAFHPDFLDCEIYRKERLVTIAGKVAGTEIKKLGERDYLYPLIRIKEIHLWKQETPPPPSPWGLWDGWWGPPWRYPYRPYYW